MSAFLDRLLNKPTKTKIAEWAKTATPEEISVAMDALVSEVEKKAEGKDASMHKEGCSNDDCKGCKDAAPGKDAKSMDRKRFYDALDRMLDGKEEEMNAADADMEELKAMFNGGGKGKDETVAGEQSGKEMPENGGIDESVEALTIEPEDRTKSSGTGTDEASYKAGAFAVLKSLKPFIAASKNKAAIGAFDTAVKIVAGSSTSKGGYGAVVKAAATVGADAVKQKTQQEIANAAIDEATKANAARFNQRN